MLADELAARMRPPGLLLTAAEAAQMLGVGRSKLFELTASGKLVAVAVPGLADRRWRRSDLERFVERMKAAK